MTIANPSQLEAVRATPALSRFKYDAVPSLKLMNLSIAVLYARSIFAADTLLYAMTLAFDLSLWTFAAYRLWRGKTLYPTWTRSSNPRRSYCAFSVWPYDLEHCVTCCAGLWANFHQVCQPSTTYPCLNYSVFYADTLCHAVTLIFDLLNLNFYSTSDVMRLKSVPNLSEID